MGVVIAFLILAFISSMSFIWYVYTQGSPMVLAGPCWVWCLRRSQGTVYWAGELNTAHLSYNCQPSGVGVSPMYGITSGNPRHLSNRKGDELAHIEMKTILGSSERCQRDENALTRRYRRSGRSRAFQYPGAPWQSQS